MESQVVPTPSAARGAAKARVIVFVCANCATRPTGAPDWLLRPSRPAFPWSCAVEEVVVPCSGRLQPEHVLKAFEIGADLVCVIACDEDDCHYLEGSCRAGRRVKYIQQLLEDISMDPRRLIICHLPGSAREEMNLGDPRKIAHQAESISQDELSRQVVAVAALVADRLVSLSPSPLRQPSKVDDEVDTAEVEVVEENDE